MTQNVQFNVMAKKQTKKIEVGATKKIFHVVQNSNLTMDSPCSFHTQHVPKGYLSQSTSHFYIFQEAVMDNRMTNTKRLGHLNKTQHLCTRSII